MTGLFVDQLTVIDCSYLDHRRGIVGESWIVDIVLEGELNDEGMVFDFGHVKKQIKRAVDGRADHKLLVPLGMPGLRLIRDDSQFAFELDCERGPIAYRSPSQAVCALDTERVTGGDIKAELLECIRGVVPANVRGVELTLRTEDIGGAYYHYSHGLKKHRGDCQRICHGHRSRIEIYRNEQRDAALEHDRARKWCDIYLVTEEDITAQRGDTVEIAYEAGQGRFELSLPAGHCDILPGDSTVELIADHIARSLKKQYPDDTFKVKAFEGINKGAIAEA